MKVPCLSLAFCSMLFMACCCGGAGSPQPPMTAAEKAAAEKRAAEEDNYNGLALVKDSVASDNGTITGEVINRRSRKLSYVQIQFILLDDNGAQIGTALANTNNLEPGATWKFTAHALGVRKAAKYKFSELSGF